MSRLRPVFPPIRDEEDAGLQHALQEDLRLTRQREIETQTALCESIRYPGPDGSPTAPPMELLEEADMQEAIAESTLHLSPVGVEVAPPNAPVCISRSPFILTQGEQNRADDACHAKLASSVAYLHERKGGEPRLCCKVPVKKRGRRTIRPTLSVGVQTAVLNFVGEGLQRHVDQLYEYVRENTSHEDFKGTTNKRLKRMLKVIYKDYYDLLPDVS